MGVYRKWYLRYTPDWQSPAAAVQIRKTAAAGISLHVTRHPPVGTGREREGDLWTVRDAVALVLRRLEPLEELVQRVADHLV